MGRLALVVGSHWDRLAISSREPKGLHISEGHSIGGAETWAHVTDYGEFCALARHGEIGGADEVLVHARVRAARLGLG